MYFPIFFVAEYFPIFQFPYLFLTFFLSFVPFILLYMSVTSFCCFDVLLSMHLSINLANDQHDAQFLYFIMRLLQSSVCFEQRLAHHQEVKFY